MSYKFFKNIEGEVALVKRLSDNVFIPFDTDNVDYQEYLEWAKTNTTEAAD